MPFRLNPLDGSLIPAETLADAVSYGNVLADNTKILFGTGSDSSIYFDATNLVVNPQEVGSGVLDVRGGLIVPNIGLGGSATSPGIFLNAVTSGSTWGAGMLFNIDHTGPSGAIANFSSTVTGHGDPGFGVQLNIWGALCLARNQRAGETNNFISYTHGIQSQSICNRALATNYYVFMGAEFDVYDNIGAHSPTAVVFAYGAYIPVIPAFTGATVLGTAGILSEDNIAMATNKRLYFESSVIGGLGDTSLGYVSASSVLRVTVDGANLLDLSSSAVTVGDGKNFIIGTTTGTKWGTSDSQKMGWWGATPVVRSGKWSPTNFTETTDLDAASSSAPDVADVLCTLIDKLMEYGLLGA